MKICLIIPVHNEIQHIGALVESIKIEGLDRLVIDDGSSDESGAAASSRGAIVLTNEMKKGKGRSLQLGFEYAQSHHYDGVITMDGDGQHDPKDLKQFLALIEKYPCSVITGNRMGAHKGMPFIRVITNWSMSWLISQICRQKIPDTQCGYRYIGREILEKLRLTSKDFEIESEVLIQASQLGYKIYSVPISTIYRNEKSKINPFKDTLRFFAYLMREWRKSRK